MVWYTKLNPTDAVTGLLDSSKDRAAEKHGMTTVGYIQETTIRMQGLGKTQT